MIPEFILEVKIIFTIFAHHFISSSACNQPCCIFDCTFRTSRIKIYSLTIYMILELSITFFSMVLWVSLPISFFHNFIKKLIEFFSFSFQHSITTCSYIFILILYTTFIFFLSQTCYITMSFVFFLCYSPPLHLFLS